MLHKRTIYNIILLQLITNFANQISYQSSSLMMHLGKIFYATNHHKITGTALDNVNLNTVYFKTYRTCTI